MWWGGGGEPQLGGSHTALLLFSPPRSEVSSSSSSEPPGRSGRQLSVQVLLHSQGLQASEADSEILSSQEDLFDTEKTGECARPRPSTAFVKVVC